MFIYPTYEGAEEAVLAVIDCPPHKIGLWLPKRMSMNRVIEEFKRVSGLDGEWEGQVVQEGNPRTVKAILKIAPSVPLALMVEYIEDRVFSGTKLSDGLILATATPQETIAQALNGETGVTGSWEVQISGEATDIAPKTIVAKPVIPLETRRPLPPDIHGFTAIEWEGEARVGNKEIGCRGGETPGQQITLVVNSFKKAMSITAPHATRPSRG
jgi:hypothetical protein